MAITVYIFRVGILMAIDMNVIVKLAVAVAAAVRCLVLILLYQFFYTHN